MREIKFRGKRIDNGEWVNGYYFETGMSGVYIIGSKPQAKRTKDGMTLREKIWEYEVDPATVGQFTGLFDRRGKEIYEGDIVSIYVTKPKKRGVVKTTVQAPVEWIEQEAGFCSKHHDEYNNPVYHSLINAAEVIEIIGNIWEGGVNE